MRRLYFLYNDALYSQSEAVCKLFFVAGDPSVITGKLHMPYRTDVINHLSANRTSLLSGKIAVVTLL